MRPRWSEETLRQRLEEEAHRPFDLERGPLVRMHLFRRAPDDHIFLLGVHHIVGDFWSLVLVIEEMQALYPAECEGRRAPLPAPASRYRDFVRWQAELLAGPEGERLWRLLEAAARRCAVRARPPDRPAAAACLLAARRDRPLAARTGPGPPAQGTGRERRAPRSTPCSLAAFQVQLGRYTGQEDFLVGCPFAGRTGRASRT